MKPCVWLLLLPGLLAGCSLWKGHEPSKAKATAQAVEPRYIGEIASVNPEVHFVLIDVSGFQAPAAGTELFTQRDGQESSRLRTGGEVRRPFAAADILSGDPQIGDSVWLPKK